MADGAKYPFGCSVADEAELPSFIKTRSATGGERDCSSDTPLSFLHFDGRDVSHIHTQRAEGLLEPLISGKLVFSSMALRKVTAKTFTGTPEERC